MARRYNIQTAYIVNAFYALKRIEIAIVWSIVYIYVTSSQHGIYETYMSIQNVWWRQKNAVATADVKASPNRKSEW